jgi:cAMP-dependent protein kinase regulator
MTTTMMMMRWGRRQGFIVGAMFVKEFKKDDVIIQQGDDGDNFYIIDKGVVDCFRKSDPDEADKLVLTYQEKGAFGELAIMYNAPRAATCVARSDCRMYALERKAFKHILMKTTIEKRQNYRGFLQNVPILSELNE